MPLSNSFTEQAFSGGGDPILTLIRVYVDGEYYHYVNNNETIQSNVSGTVQAYQRAAFKIRLPEDSSKDGAPSAALDFETGDIQVIRRLREADKKIIVDLWLVLASNTNIIEFGPANYESQSFDVSASTVSLELTAEPILDISYPAHRFTPQLFPLLWEGR